MEKIVLYAIVMLVFFGAIKQLHPDLRKSFARWNRIRLLRKKAVPILIEAIRVYGGYLKIDSIDSSEHSEFRRKLGLQNSPYFDYSCRNFIANAFIPSLKVCSLFTDFADQLLKMYADNLQYAYNEEEKLRKEFKGKEAPDSFSRGDIEFLLEKDETVRRKIDDAETNFWSLHDVLDDIGHTTWGYKGYKVYVCLKPALPSKTLCSFTGM